MIKVKASIKVDRIRLDAVMLDRGLTNVSLSQKMECYIGTIQRIKLTGNISLDTLEVMCAVLECHPFDLLVCKGYPEVRLPRMGESLFLKNGQR